MVIGCNKGIKAKIFFDALRNFLIILYRNINEIILKRGNLNYENYNNKRIIVLKSYQLYAKSDGLMVLLLNIYFKIK